MRQAHCGVFPSRAEGWNMELLEMMSCGRQVITTEYSAHTEFCNHNNSHLIPITSLEEAFDGIWFQGQGQWAQLDKDAVDMLSSLMVKVYKAGPLKNYSGIETAKKFSWDNSALAAQKGIENEIV
jgi:glycosyltransferase involved in cell wall biosynthesis